jgi:transcriptional regulator with XRE-family HTH domain
VSWRPGSKQGKPKTKLAEKRLERQMSQRDMVEATGIPMATYQRMEMAERKTAPYEYLARCADVLGVALDDLIEEKYKSRTSPRPTGRKPPKERRARQAEGR